MGLAMRTETAVNLLKQFCDGKGVKCETVNMVDGQEGTGYKVYSATVYGRRIEFEEEYDYRKKAWRIMNVRLYHRDGTRTNSGEAVYDGAFSSYGCSLREVIRIIACNLTHWQTVSINGRDRQVGAFIRIHNNWMKKAASVVVDSWYYGDIKLGDDYKEEYREGVAMVEKAVLSRELRPLVDWLQEKGYITEEFLNNIDTCQGKFDVELKAKSCPVTAKE